MREIEFITGQVIFNGAYNEIFRLKTTLNFYHLRILVHSKILILDNEYQLRSRDCTPPMVDTEKIRLLKLVHNKKVFKRFE